LVITATDAPAMQSLSALQKNNEDRPVYDNLRYHNQFVLGPSYIEELADWQRFEVIPSIHLMAHPALNTYQARNAGRSLTLVGYILDPDRPQSSDADIIETLILKLTDFESFIARTHNYGGRWILVVNDGRKIALLNDAVGLRQVFYTETPYADQLWCASQPEIMAGLLGLTMDKAAVGFINSYEFRVNPEFRFPGNSSPYREIKHLLPNHYLDLKTGLCRRYWPSNALPEIGLDEAIENVSSILQGLMQSAANRFDLALSITAGLDSRVVLAASRPISHSITYMTVRQIGMPDDHADLTTPSQLLSKLGLNHDIVKSSLIIDDEFIEIFKQNVPIPHYVYAPDAQAILKHYAQCKVAVTGSSSEVSRFSFRALTNKSQREKLTLLDFADLQHMGKHKFAFHHYQSWLDGLGPLYNVDLLNLFEWELDDGNWLAMCQLEFDIAWKDIFTPFNCRSLINCLLSIKPHYLHTPKFEFHHRLISNLWPEVLNVPINPHKHKKAGLFSKIKSFARMRQLADIFYR
jgi:hypothetical protein